MNEHFNYTYSAPTEEERKEIDSIRRQYSATPKKQETKLERLRRLDSTVKNTAVIISLCLGVAGVLIFGLGMTMILEWKLIPLGCIAAGIGSIPAALAYPTYKRLIKKGKEKYGEEILTLSNQLLNQSDTKND